MYDIAIQRLFSKGLETSQAETIIVLKGTGGLKAYRDKI